MRRTQNVSRLPAGTIITLVTLTLGAFALDGCLWMDPRYQELMDARNGSGDQGGYDGVVIDLPFANGYESLCTQGTHDTPTHNSKSTELDLDFDTPNGDQDLVFAPIGGTAYVHTESSSRNFGYHVNIDLGDGTYVVLAHFADVFVSDGSEVAAGQILGYEGCTGNCDGDHVHAGLHDGDASLMAEYGESIEVGYFVDNVSTGETDLTVSSEEFACGLDGAGDTYQSLLPVTSWHPNGTLVKTPDDNNVYLIDHGMRRWIETEDVFWELGYDFSEVVLISPDELACYGAGETIVNADDVAFTVDNAMFRDGDLVKEASRSDVYVISEGMAMPIQTWEIFLRLGFGSRAVTTVDDGVIASYGLSSGNCSSGYACIDAEAIESCGGSVAGTGGAEGQESEESGDEGSSEEEEEADDEDDEDPQSKIGAVEVCYLPGTTMAEGELYLDGDAFTYWGSPVADTASSGDTRLCATVEADSGEQLKLNAWYATSSGGNVYWAAYNDNCTSVEFRGTVQVDGVSVVLVVSPWSADAWESDPCSIGADAYFEVP